MAFPRDTENFGKNLAKIWQKLTNFVEKDPFYFSLVIIVIILALFFRFYNYWGRVAIMADNSQDVQIARFAKDHFKLPLAGPFSSAGPFFYGPWYFWFGELISFIPLGFLTFWYVISFLNLLFIALIFMLGKEVGGKKTAILAALMAAVSPMQIASSVEPWNPSIVPILTLIELIFLVKFYEKRKTFDLFLLSFLIGLSITIHFQSVLTLPVAGVALIFIKRTRLAYLRNLPLMLAGFLIPFIPLIYLDVKLGWYNSRNIFIFLTVDQFSAWIPNRWLTYIFSYWPTAWSEIIGGSRWVSILEIAIILIFSLVNLKRIRKNAIYFLIAITFCIEIILYRYYRGQRFQYYSYFAHGPVIVLSAWGVNKLFEFRKILGAALLFVIIVSTFQMSLTKLKNQDITMDMITRVKKEIYQQFPGRSFDVYGCIANPNAVSHPLALMMYQDRRDDLTGEKIGICISNEGISWKKLTAWDLNHDHKILWYERSTEKVYFDTAEWWLKSPPPPGNGMFLQYLKTHLSPRCWPHC